MIFERKLASDEEEFEEDDAWKVLTMTDPEVAGLSLKSLFVGL